MTKEINIGNLHIALEVASLKISILELAQKAIDEEYQNFPDLLKSDSMKLLKKINEIEDLAL